MSHVLGEPSSWITRWAPAVTADATVLDLACGGGRHLRWWAARGHRVTGVDRDAAALATLAGLGELITADIENAAWPLAGRQFDLVLVTNYLWRPLWPHILASIAPGGLLLYETFAQGHEALGRPSRPDFLLQPAELLTACAGLEVLGYEAGQLAAPPRIVQRIAARRSTPAQAPVHLPPP